ncbi:MAG: nucleotidyltransferase family protein [Chloroflexi bacterium]|jgi:glucose-1-phosphate thymidylyltransferase|nr:nucleotidyltransferase family protein [Chloroflexota bacterium]
MKSLILASGFGTRLYPLTTTKAKALLEYKGKASISHIVGWIPQDIDILVNINKKFEADFRRWQDTIGRAVTLCVEPVFTEEQAFGAVGSLDYWIRAKNINDDLLVIASDNYFELDLRQFIAAYNGKNTLVAVYDIGDKSKASQYGVVQLDGHKITGFEEKPAQPKSSLIAIACYILPPRIFPLLFQCCAQGKRDNLGNFIAYLIETDEVHAYTFSELWFDIGSIDVYQSL